MRYSLKTEGGRPSGPRERQRILASGRHQRRPALYSSEAEIGMLARGRLPSSSDRRAAAAR
ncbi:hypothetical protein F6Y24_20715 [Xanthomonas arboricola pv. pruni]|nr:hypothetical protein F6Y24_20715 [Xanthomonas arboricola pv. pruni]RST70806.1 hypothetical protein EJK96_10485 [Xanthomonas arboricola pv. pruni]RST75025.1 hypothetical protein EJL05_21045 [Xanthomonas arboricola pv. pruni]